jgi:hypothetical protein
VKCCELCESSSGYLWSFIIYKGRERYHIESTLISGGKQNISHYVVTCGTITRYGTFMDNFYSVATLVQKLKTYCVEILCLNMKDAPKTFRENKLKKGELIAQHSGTVSDLKCETKRVSP